jgi:ABC-type antimicrobial peptide transport system permease subunit
VEEILPGKPELGDELSWEVVGVVADEAVAGLDANPDHSIGMYVSNQQIPTFRSCVLVRGAQDTALLREPIKKTAREVNPDQTVDGMMTLDEIKANSLGDKRFRMLLLATFAAVSLLLSAIGIYGVISYAVTQRTREIGIRNALGASRGNIVLLVLRHGMRLLVLGLLLGVAGTLGLTRLLASLLFGVGERDPITLATVAFVLSLVALNACILPALRATRVSPVEALRAE